MIVDNNYSNEFLSLLKDIESIDVYDDGKKKTLNHGEEAFNSIIDNMKENFYGSRIEPAFGVSLHDLTIKEMEKGKWMKLNFSSQKEVNGLPFSSLLFQQEECYGLNLIREYNNKFDGRCIYLSLNGLKDLSLLY